MCKSERVFDGTIELKDNAMLKHKPELFYEWDFEKNDELGLDIYKVTYGSGKKAYWICTKNHRYHASPNSRNNMMSGCPYCSGHTAWIGETDMWTTNPRQAKLLADSEDGYRYTQKSNEKVDWKCPECENIIENKQILNINTLGLSCPKCSDGVKFPEKFMYNLLKEANIEFEFNTAQNWSQGKRYDFYLPEYNWVIETHGIQHYEESFKYSSRRTRTLAEEQENDELKEKLAKENGINKYIIIDSRVSTIEWLENSILNSCLIDIIEDIDFESIGELASSNIVKIACNLWGSGIRDVSEIAKSLKLGRSAVLRYLKRGAEIGWCSYCPEASRRSGFKKVKKSVIQLSFNLDFIKEWDSATDVQIILGTSSASISQCLRDIRPSAGGFKWMYKEEYDALHESNSTNQRSQAQ